MYKVFTRQNCPHCEQAKQTFNAHQVQFEEIVIGQDITREEVIKQFPNATIAPVIVSPDGYEIPAQYLDILLKLEKRKMTNG